MSKTDQGLSPARIILFLYLGVILLFSFLYSLPFSQTDSIRFIDSLFVSASALSVTGLSTIDISEEFTFIGQLFLLIEIQIGGIGIMAILAYLIMFSGKNFSISQLMLMSFDQNQKSVKSIKSIMMSILVIAFVVETLGFSLLFPTISSMYDDTFEAVFITIFHSASSFTNAGFDLFSDSLISFKENNLFVITTSLLILAGVIGFPTIIEIISKWHKKKSLFTKTNLFMHAVLIIFGFTFFLIFESRNTLSGLSLVDKLNNALLLSMIPRNAGITTIDIATLGTGSLLIMMFLMFIGASPSSTGGGIRTTTFAVLASKTWSSIKGREETVLFKKTVPQEDVNKAFMIFIMFSSIAFLSTVIVSLIEPHFTLEQIAFEVMSALSTTGLSMGITAELSNASQMILIALMIIGRIGFVTWIYLFIKTRKTQTKYISESIVVG